MIRLITANTRPPKLTQLLGFVRAPYRAYPGISFFNRPKLNLAVSCHHLWALDDSLTGAELYPALYHLLVHWYSLKGCPVGLLAVAIQAAWSVHVDWWVLGVQSSPLLWSRLHDHDWINSPPSPLYTFYMHGKLHTH